MAYVLTDVAGLRERTDDPVEAIGIARARDAMAGADLVVWLGDDPPPTPNMLPVHPRADLPGRDGDNERLSVSATTGAGIDGLWCELHRRAAELIPRADETAFNERQREQLATAAAILARLLRTIWSLSPRISARHVWPSAALPVVTTWSRCSTLCLAVFVSASDVPRETTLTLSLALA